MTKLARAASLLLAVTSPSASTAFIVGSASRSFMSTSLNAEKFPILCAEDVMSPKAHGTSDKPVMKDLKWGCDYETADRICNFNRHYAEHAGYWSTTKYLEEVDKENPTKYFDAVTGKHLFTAPAGRSMEQYLAESGSHGWPSFRDEEVNWDYVRCLDNGECVSVTGTHLGHNLPDSKGNRYCINLVCVAGQPAQGEE
eukprot:CAMPEP_0194122662 /NCGR_PEP_ID=MMETSP0150-20130528/51446_1 /TAXON_ID=122233 /ORGANISM="Chaetoceros debilis, Strain MM31A-1" /LENGTH=197 /DNA_ID=CAMNT_0038815607 /DNA_START=48 /DNA_END=641 /DNA_ORIENTATION=+